MKKTILSLMVSLAIFAGKAEAQKPLQEATLTYKITVKAEADKIPAGMENAKMVVYLKPTQSRREFITNLGTETTIYDSRAGKGFILKEFSGQKLMITMSNADWAQLTEKNRTAKFSETAGTTTVAGYSAKKVVGTFDDGKTVTVFYDPSLSVVNKQYHNAFPQLAGIPVQFEMQSGNLTFVYTLESVSEDPVSATKFEAPSSGYRVMTFAETQQMKKG